MTSPASVTSSVLEAIDEGHVFTRLDNNGHPKPESKCLKDAEFAPCTTMREARALDQLRRSAARL